MNNQMASDTRSPWKSVSLLRSRVGHIEDVNARCKQGLRGVEVCDKVDLNQRDGLKRTFSLASGKRDRVVELKHPKSCQ